MKKKLLSVLLAVTLVAAVFTGCGDKDADKDDKNVEATDDADDDDDKGDADKDDAEEDKSGEGEIMTEGPDVEDGLIESEGEVTPIEDEEEDDDTVVSDDKDWSTAYDDFFSREGIIPEKVMMTMNMEMEGMVFDVKVAGVDNNVYMSYDFGTAVLDLYSVDGVVYAHAVMGADEVWNYANATQDEIDSMFTVTDTSFAEAEAGTECTYREEVVEDGVVYDVLDVVVEEDGESQVVGYYVNRETQVIEKCVVVQDGMEVAVLISEIDGVELPAEAANATEATMEDIGNLLIGVMLVGMGMEM